MELHVKPSEKAYEFYKKHSFAYEGDSGLDLFILEDTVIPEKSVKIIDLEISVEAREISKRNRLGSNSLYSNKSTLLMARSSIYKTPLRLANGVGLIDSCYRGTIKAAFDNISEEPYLLKKGTRLVQIVSYNLEPFNVVLSNSLSDTQRNQNGFGSSGV